MGRSGVFSSVGAAVSLLLASGVVLLVMSSLIAYHGWPGVRDAGASPARVALAASPATPSLERATQRVVLRGATRRTRRAIASAAPRSAPARRATPVTGAPARGRRQHSRGAGQVRGVSYSSRPAAASMTHRGAAPPATPPSTPTAVNEVETAVEQAGDEVEDLLDPEDRAGTVGLP